MTHKNHISIGTGNDIGIKGDRFWGEGLRVKGSGFKVKV